MTLHLDGHAYTLSVDDYDPEHGASYAWEGPMPVCPECRAFLAPHELLVHEQWNGSADLCHRDCGWEARAAA